MKEKYAAGVKTIKNHYMLEDPAMRTVCINDWPEKMNREFINHPEYMAERVSLSLIQQIREAMEAQGVTREELAKRVGVSRQFIHQILNGECGRTIKTIAKIAAALGFNNMEIKLSYVDPDNE